MSIEVYFDETKECALLVRRTVPVTRKINVKYFLADDCTESICNDSSCILCFPVPQEKEIGED